MKKNGYSSAFTITEAIVSMVVTGVILAIIFVIFQIAIERLYDFRTQNEDIADMNRFTYSINKSIFESEAISKIDNYLEFQSYSGSKIYYYIEDGYLLRQQGVMNDTFKIDINSFKIDTVSSVAGTNVFQRLRWNISINNAATELVFFKKVYADKLLSASK